jgi:hypothetical protein
VHIEVSFFVASIDIDSSLSEVSTLELSTSRDAPSIEVCGSLTPDVLRERGNVGRRTSSSLDSVFNVNVSRGGAGGPGNRGVKSSNISEISVFDTDLYSVMCKYMLERNLMKRLDNGKNLST